MSPSPPSLCLQTRASAVHARTFSSASSTHVHRANNNDNTPFEFSDESYKEVAKIMAKYPVNQKRSASTLPSAEEALPSPCSLSAPRSFLQ